MAVTLLNDPNGVAMRALQQQIGTGDAKAPDAPVTTTNEPPAIVDGADKSVRDFTKVGGSAAPQVAASSAPAAGAPMTP